MLREHVDDSFILRVEDSFIHSIVHAEAQDYFIQLLR